MKHAHLRKDKTCLNCGAIVPERYCSHCGQENTDPKESFGHLIGHFFADVTHYDSQFFTTIKDLIIKPGFLTREYNAGKRLSYLNPIRMYIFISAIFFLVLFSQKSKETKAGTAPAAKHEVNLFRQHLADSLMRIVKVGHELSKDSIRKNLYISLATRLDTPAVSSPKDESVGAFLDNHGIITFKIKENRYHSIKQYDLEQRKLPDSAKNGIIGNYFIHKIIRLTNNGNQEEVVLTQDVAHDIPKIVFFLLPLFALFISLFYSRKKYFYTQHAIFSLHFHSFVFLGSLAVSILCLITDSDNYVFLLSVAGVSLLGVFIYLATALHNVYQETLWLSAIKAVAVSILYFIAIAVAFCIVIIAYFIFI